MSDRPNEEQIQYWNGPVGERWAGLQEKIDENLSAITDALIDFAGATKGEHVLDLGCGCGTTSFILEKLTGEKSKVIGIDISNPMLEVARARAKKAHSQAMFLEADAAVHDFGNHKFDLIFSRFGVMFFEDPIAGFTNIRHAMHKGGRVTFVCWRAMKENDWANVPYQAALHLLPPQEASDPLAPGPFAFADPARVKTILVRAGLKDVAIEKLDTKMRMGGTVKAAAEEVLNIGPLAKAAQELPETTREKIRAAAEAAFRRYENKDGVVPPAACWLVRAHV